MSDKIAEMMKAKALAEHFESCKDWLKAAGWHRIASLAASSIATEQMREMELALHNEIDAARKAGPQ